LAPFISKNEGELEFQKQGGDGFGEIASNLSDPRITLPRKTAWVVVAVVEAERVEAIAHTQLGAGAGKREGGAVSGTDPCVIRLIHAIEKPIRHRLGVVVLVGGELPALHGGVVDALGIDSAKQESARKIEPQRWIGRRKRVARPTRNLGRVRAGEAGGDADDQGVILCSDQHPGVEHSRVEVHLGPIVKDAECLGKPGPGATRIGAELDDGAKRASVVIERYRVSKRDRRGREIGEVEKAGEVKRGASALAVFVEKPEAVDIGESAEVRAGGPAVLRIGLAFEIGVPSGLQRESGFNGGALALGDPLPRSGRRGVGVKSQDGVMRLPGPLLGQGDAASVFG